MPVLFGDLHHVVDARIVTHLHLRQPEVGALASVPRHDVVDDRSAVATGDCAHLPELVFGAELVVEPGADPIEVAVHTRGGLPTGNPPGPLDRPGVHSGNADSL